MWNVSDGIQFSAATNGRNWLKMIMTDVAHAKGNICIVIKGIIDAFQTLLYRSVYLIYFGQLTAHLCHGEKALQ